MRLLHRGAAAMTSARHGPPSTMKLPPVLALVGLLCAGCASIPPEAPELSAQLGSRISAVESAHRRLLADFFNEKRRRVDEFVQETWVPLFAKNFFDDPKIAAVWQQVVASSDPNDRLKFITMVGPKLQEKINAKRTELIQPLDQLEQEIALKLQAEYDQMQSINGTLTAFLQSASKVEENRKRYLEMIGVNDNKVSSVLGQAENAVSELVQATDSIEAKTQQAEAFRDKVKTIINQLRAKN